MWFIGCLHYDQNGNGLKVENHGLGLRGVFQSERSLDMTRKMEELLEKPGFREALADFKERISSVNSDSDMEEQLQRLIKSLSPDAYQQLEARRAAEV
ncbi:hypothetical protein [Dyadobacter psychrotolerans]|uniref:Uncharacterized protein n=1 Tax=Dyadobacter psychrotolerans TaxID=2541721 RepID=A0A4R5DCH2_9BACT|nr:hypothetical protein [Dyadobacter psychrotolerans]TDE07963.1 hypothetical protein E0F88_33390 [Dyadobacter psychrotolerans]